MSFQFYCVLGNLNLGQEVVTFIFFVTSSRCKTVGAGVNLMGGCTHRMDYSLPALQSSVWGGGRLPLLYNSTGHSLRCFLMPDLLKIANNPL